ncbi:MAG: hypothetical protein ACRDYD_00040 [Acidimicrobiales bacterium]
MSEPTPAGRRPFLTSDHDPARYLRQLMKAYEGYGSSPERVGVEKELELLSATAQGAVTALRAAGAITAEEAGQWRGQFVEAEASLLHTERMPSGPD